MITPFETYITNFSDLRIINEKSLVSSIYFLEREREREYI
jgi:hypothetical protein